MHLMYTYFIVFGTLQYLNNQPIWRTKLEDEDNHKVKVPSYAAPGWFGVGKIGLCQRNHIPCLLSAHVVGSSGRDVRHFANTLYSAQVRRWSRLAWHKSCRGQAWRTGQDNSRPPLFDSDHSTGRKTRACSCLLVVTQPKFIRICSRGPQDVMPNIPKIPVLEH